MDGTGLLFQPLIQQFDGDIDYEIIPLSSFNANSPFDQAAELAHQLTGEEVILLAESYSGLIAYEACQRDDINIAHVFFIASFLERPSMLSKFSRLLPLSIVRKKIIPTAVLSYLFFGNINNRPMVELFYQSLNLGSDESLRLRLDVISRATLPTKPIDQNVTYIGASRDWLVSNAAVNTFKRLCLNMNQVTVQGGHFILQSNPQHCWQEIRWIINTKN